MGGFCSTNVENLPTSGSVIEGTDIPEWVSAGGKILFEQAAELAGGELPAYVGPRIASYDGSKLTPEEASQKYNFHIVDKRTQNKLKYNNRAGSITKDITHNDPRHPVFGLMCEKPFSVIYINYNGDYNLFFNDGFNPTVLENVQTQPLRDFIESNEKLKEFQRDLAAGNRTYSPCKSCNKPLHPKAEKYMYKQLSL